MAGPWDKYAQPTEGPWTKYQTQNTPAIEPEQNEGLGLGRGAGLVTRAIVQGVTAPPLMAMDIGVSLRNVLERALADKEEQYSQYELPSSMFNRALTEAGLPEPSGLVEKAGSFIISAMTGSRMKSPQSSNVAPKGFVKPESVRDATLKAAQREGYVVPPATTNPTVTNRALEGAAGKVTTAQLAAMKNAKTTDALARRALGLSRDVPITKETLKGLREAAGKVYDDIGNAGDIVADSQYIDDLAKLGSSVDEIAKSFPEANVGSSKEIGKLVDSLLQPKFGSKAALEYVKELRNTAQSNLSPLAAADPSKRALGMAQREAASILEDRIMRHLVQNGDEAVAQSFGQARKLIAISHTVENALNEGTGHVSAAALGSQLKRGKPLSGELEIVAKFAQAFPKAAREVNESMPGISPLDYYGAGGATVVTGNPLPLLYPAARMAIRSALLTGPGQKLATEAVKGAPRETLGLIPSAAIQGVSEVNR